MDFLHKWRVLRKAIPCNDSSIWGLNKHGRSNYMINSWRCHDMETLSALLALDEVTRVSSRKGPGHYNHVTMGSMASQITSLTIVYSAVYSGASQSSASLAFVRGIHRGPVNSSNKGSVTRIMFPIDDVDMRFGVSFVVRPNTKCMIWYQFRWKSFLDFRLIG